MGAEFFGRRADPCGLGPAGDLADAGDGGDASCLQTRQQGRAISDRTAAARDGLVQRSEPGPWPDLAARSSAPDRQTQFRGLETCTKAPMRTDLFDFELPAESIALRPVSPRDSARMLVVVPPDGVLRDCSVADLPHWLEPGDQLVVNDTRVISAQLSGRRIGRDTEPKIEATLIKRLDGSRWQALVRPAKKLSQGDVVRFGNEGRVCLLGHLDAQVEHKGDDGEITLSFSFHGPALDQAIADLGNPPLPPYIASKRTPDERDAADYQTMFAAHEGAVAAPTAGLHFTPALEAALRGRGVELHRLTLHVGAGTFLPVKVDETSAHKMHAEWGAISPETAAALNAARAKGSRIVAVGTTSLRLLESAAAEDGTIQPFCA